MHILVTGGAGFIGSHAAGLLLREGHEVTILDDFNDYYDPGIKRSNVAHLSGGAELVDADIRDVNAVAGVFERRRIDTVLHLAARAGVRPSLQDPRLYVDTNIGGTLNLLEAARRCGVSRFLFASSSSVYGSLKTTPFSEEMAIRQTLSPYAATKIAGEHLCGNYANLYGMRVVCLRFFTVYGPGQRPDLAIHKFTDAIFHDRAIPQFGDGSSRRDYTYIDDILHGIMGSLRYEGPVFDIFNLGESETTSLRDLIAAIEKALGKRARIEVLPEQKGDMPVTCADISKARKLLGYSPGTPIAEGIPKFVEWYLSRREVRQ